MTSSLWHKTYTVLMAHSHDTVLGRVCLVIKRFVERANELAYTLHLTKYKPISKLSVEDFLSDD